ncbi:MAG: metallophosphoesterase [Candidatus Riflebacteria bacterium]|nr:metallophosphoesterase [Candidatus Riflebacteria bacterium]
MSASFIRDISNRSRRLFAVFTITLTVFSGIFCPMASGKSVRRSSAIASSSSSIASSSAMQIGWGPVLGLVTPDSAAIRWSTTATMSCALILNGAQSGEVISDGVWHQISLEGLNPATKYTYQIMLSSGSRQIQSDAFSFSTPPSSLDTWSFVAFGDTRTNHADHKSVVDAILRVAPKPMLVIHSGDMGENGASTDCWNTFFTIEKNLQNDIPFMACLGNHEKNSPIFYRMFQNPLSVGGQSLGYYSFKFGTALFIVLNSESDPSPQAAFLEKTLQNAVAENIPWKFVLWHQTPFSSGSHGGNVNLANLWVPIMEKYGVTCGFYGHDHLYEHSIKNGYHHVTTGGGGAPLYAVTRNPNPYSKTAISKLHFLLVNVTPKKVSITAIGTDDGKIDTFDVPLSVVNSKTRSPSNR